MSSGLPVSRLINVSVNLAPTAAQAPNLNSFLIVGDSDVIDTQTRIESFSALSDVALRFGTSAPEYAAAALYFAQVPSPTQVYIGRWAQAAVAGRMFGGALTTAQQALANFTAITTGAFKIVVDGGAAINVPSINLSGASNLNGVATLINTALTTATAGATVSWDGTRFVFKSNTTGTASSVGPLQAPTSGVDIKALLNGTVATGSRSVQGVIAETALAAITTLDSQPVGFYGLTLASINAVDADHLAIAAYIEGASRKHVYGVSTSAAGSIDATSTTDIGYLLKAAAYMRSVVQYSATPYAVASLFGRILTTNFDANNSMITLMYKQEPGITAELLTTQQADALKNKNVNVFTFYDNNTAIIEYGTTANGYFFDEVLGADWLRGRLMTDLYNALYTSLTKIPQTDAGMAQLATVIEAACAAAVNNGLVGPGTWTSGGFGQLKTGQFLSAGFYVYTPPLSAQSDSDRSARKSVAFQVAAKLAGAVHSVDVVVNINR